jgi:microcystin-dependent protein
MSDPFVAEIRIFPYNFAPKGWAFCNGQLMPISQNTALFSLLGTFYGGDGKSTFALPDLQDSAPVQSGLGAGLTDRFLGERGGQQSVTLVDSETPSHNHALSGHTDTADVADPSPARSLARSQNAIGYQTTINANLVNLSPQALAAVGGGQPHNNLPPYLVLNFNIALQGVFPPRN